MCLYIAVSILIVLTCAGFFVFVCSFVGFFFFVFLLAFSPGIFVWCFLVGDGVAGCC